jgi:hypothetical protein
VEVNTLPLFTGFGPQDLVIDAKNNRIYWADVNAGNIMKANLDGTGTPTPVFNTNQVGSLSPVGLALSNGVLYWGEGNTNTIQKGNVDGTGYGVLFGDKPEEGVTVAVDIEIEVTGNKLYWTETGEQQVVRGNLDGSGVPEVLFDGADGLQVPYGLQVDAASGKLYVADTPSAYGIGPDDRILSGNLNGTGRLTPLFEAGDGVTGATGLAIDTAAGKLYWMNQNTGVDPFVISIARGNLDGSGEPEILVNNIPSGGLGMAVQVEE